MGMKRREFIALLGGVVVPWPLSARAQPGRPRNVVMFVSTEAEDPDTQARVTAFLQGLQQLGWTDGRNVRIQTRWNASSPDRIRKYVAELAGLEPDIIVATDAATLGPLLQATRTVPIVFVIVPDPVGSGFVESLSRPGGNATGFTQFEYSLSAKWLELLKQMAPDVTRAAILRDPTMPDGIGQFAVIQSMAPSIGIDVTSVNSQRR
jgi:putative tryptophan/tyrosine transport system substrate-binding protein